MITHIMLGHFLFGLNLILLPLLLTFLPMCARSLALPWRLSSATMAASSTTPWPALSSSLTVPFFACLAPTPLSKMVKPSALFAPLIILCAPCFFQGSLPPVYWVESLHTATYLLNRHPTSTLGGRTPFFALYDTHPTYTHLRVFGCACYPNLSATATHKLSPRSSLCVFLGYSSDHKGYRCLDLHSNRIIISCHVVFDESVFPFSEMSTFPSDPSCNTPVLILTLTLCLITNRG